MGYSEAQSAVIIHYIPGLPGEPCGQTEMQVDVLQAERRDSVLSQCRKQALFEDAVLAMFQSTPDGRFIAVNSAFAQLFGYCGSAEVKACVQDIARDLFVRPEQSMEISELVLKERVEKGFEVSYRRKDGSVFVGNLHIWAVRDSEGGVLCLEGCIEDITERKAMEKQLLYLCTHDALTGLCNRWYFEQEMERLGRGRELATSILVADIDELKLVNDQEGHIAGDRQLQQAARLLLEGCRADDIVARTGGDEFAVLLPHTDAATVGGIVRRLRQDLASQGVKRVGPTLSLAFGVATAEPGENLIDAFQRADQQMYHDKARRTESRQS